ncbi:MAG: D-alanyl-D-alanine carboxypeptidase family protein [Candidatus Daviesbacteria bacterium]
MNRKVFTVILTTLFFIFIGVFLWNFQAKNTLISPEAQKEKGSSNLWFPQAEASSSPHILPEISAQAIYFVEINSGQVLYQQNQDQKLPVASLVKVMTAIIASENKGWKDQIEISSKAASMEPDYMQLKVGEKLTVEELLYGLFLVSANDAAESLAEGSLESREEFIKQMNEKAKNLGMNNTLFINPTGLEEDGRQQYSTAFDVLIMSRFAIKHFPHLLDITSTPHIILPQTSTHQDYDLYSGINLLTTYPGVIGFKTGYTPEAGLTLITLAQKENYLVLGVILNSNNRREEAKELLDYSFLLLSKGL